MIHQPRARESTRRWINEHHGTGAARGDRRLRRRRAVAARELHAAGAEITLLEAEPRLGGHAHTVTVEARDGAWDVDTGFIVLNDRNYPNSSGCWTSCASPPSPPR